MILEDLLDEERRVRPGTLTVLTQDPRTNGSWLVPVLAGGEAIIVTFEEPLATKSAKVVDVSTKLFAPNFEALAFKEIEPEVKGFSVVALVLPDVLVGAGVPSSTIFDWIRSLLMSGKAVVVSVAVSGPLTDPSLPTGVEQRRLVTQLLHGSAQVLALRPLSTGRAEDYTGVLTIRSGPHSTDSKFREFLYTIKQKSVDLTER